MSKFKVGDKVVVINEGETGEWASEGAVGYVTECDTNDCAVEFIHGNFKTQYGNTWFIAYDSLELLKEDLEVEKPKKQPHVHAELIKAWADGADIEHYHPTHRWTSAGPTPAWSPTAIYRIKPKVASDVTKVVTVVIDNKNSYNTKKIELVFNPEMTEIKSAKIINIVPD
jgi:O-methyltransferase involved in polyketide biosynthesis